MGKRQQQKLLAIFEKCIKDGDFYDGNIDEINYYNLMFKAGTNDTLESWGDANVCAFKYNYKNNESILIIIGIPINSEKETSTSKNIAERIMEIVKDSELCFTTLDYNTSTEVKKDKFIYITFIKKIEEES